MAILEDFTEENIEKVYRELSEELQLKAGQLIHPTRLALTGRTATPGLFEVMVLLGQERCLVRMERAIKFIESAKA